MGGGLRPRLRTIPPSRAACALISEHTNPTPTPPTALYYDCCCCCYYYYYYYCCYCYCCYYYCYYYYYYYYYYYTPTTTTKPGAITPTPSQTCQDVDTT